MGADSLRASGQATDRSMDSKTGHCSITGTAHRTVIGEIGGSTMQRYLILNGDRTTANGTVQATATTIELNGKNVAHEGDSVSCPACNTTGKIQCDGPRQMMTAPDGRHAALSDDLCICGCHPPPKLITSQSMMSTEA
jgi:uncharacterized Zn-binding protein involved in type VI secretion